ncbi:MAG TPA: hypothetical protein DDW76_09010 [Cyanobacteria bacterium UBA11369]|nr:hypothetical protein [Cyanobacteria bacterium UBA11371]HBE48919.1 hypothetical protein [Cyanobacteria bacterium UBA11369]
MLEGYNEFLRGLRERIEEAQVRAAIALNTELVLLYWLIGRDILTRQQQQAWGAKVINRLATNLRSAFPEMKGFSRSNLMFHILHLRFSPAVDSSPRLIAKVHALWTVDRI